MFISDSIVFYYIFIVLLLLWVYLLMAFVLKLRHREGTSKYVLIPASLLVFCNDMAILILGKLYDFSMEPINGEIQKQLMLIVYSFIAEMLILLSLAIYIATKEKKNKTK